MSTLTTKFFAGKRTATRSNDFSRFVLRPELPKLND